MVGVAVDCAAFGDFLMSMERVTTKAGGVSYWFWCPGCKIHHSFRTKLGTGERPGPVWTYDENVEKPTFGPSLMCNRGITEDHKAAGGHQCHLFLKNGIVQYLGDCTHKLAGQSIPVEDPWFRLDQGVMA